MALYPCFLIRRRVIGCAVVICCGFAFLSASFWASSRLLQDSGRMTWAPGAAANRSPPCQCQKQPAAHEQPELKGLKAEPVTCRINDDVLKNLGMGSGLIKVSSVPCLRLSRSPADVYFPFSFIQDYFEVYGQWRNGTSSGHHPAAPGPYSETSSSSEPVYFSMSHSYSRVFPQMKSRRYDPAGPFMQFASFDVASRQRVKCVSASQGVPISTQWDKKGYFYPTQIAQYALSYWSKHLQDVAAGAPPKETLYETGQMANWMGGDVTRVTDQSCVHFESDIRLDLKNSLDQPVLSFDLQVRDNVTVSVSVKLQHTGRFILQYVPTSRIDIERRGKVIQLGYGDVEPVARPHLNSGFALKEAQWRRFTRHLINDLTKGLSLKSLPEASFEVEDITFSGVGCVTNLSLADKQNLRFFFHAADWLVRSQDEAGGWPVPVTLNKGHTKYFNGAEELAPGWYSGMGQGQAISALTRAFRHSGQREYLDAAVKALALYKVASHSGGFVATFMNTYPWYEEYPTKPSSFILNGFMYSLVGLYDLCHTLAAVDGPSTEQDEAKRLFDQGLASLRGMLSLYDTGSGTVYDLRHVSMGLAPKIARWDYHAAHVNLLYTLSTVIEEPELKHFVLSTADRWLWYMLGKRAPHN